MAQRGAGSSNHVKLKARLAFNFRELLTFQRCKQGSPAPQDSICAYLRLSEVNACDYIIVGTEKSQTEGE